MFRFSLTLFLLITASYSGLAQLWQKTEESRLKHLLSGRYDSTLYYAGETLAIIRGVSGEKSADYAMALDNMAVSYFFLGNFVKAKYYILKEVALRESMGEDGRDYLNALENATVICRRAGDYEEALAQVKKADKRSLKLNGPGSIEYAKTLGHIGGVYYDMGASVNDLVYLKKALEYFDKADQLNTANGEKARFARMINKSDEAVYNNDVGNLPVAEALLQSVVEFTAKEFGISTREYAAALNNLGVLYYNSGNYKLAEKSFSEALGIYSRCEGSGYTGPGICTANLAALYHEMGNYKTAERLTTDARRILENEHMQNSTSYAVLLNNLASVYISEEYYASAELKNKEKLVNSGKLLLKADSLFSANCPGPNHDRYAIRSNLALWYVFTGDKKKAVQMSFDQTMESNTTLKVHAMMNKMESSAIISFKENLDSRISPQPVMIPVKLKMVEEIQAASAGLNASSENDAVTNKLIEWIMGRATNLKKAVGEFHPAYAVALKSLIAVYASVDAVEIEEELTREYINVINHKILQDFSFLSETEKELYYQTRLPDINAFTAYTLSRKKANPSITCHAYNNILLHKGLMLRSSTAMRVAILGSNDQELLRIYDEWIALQKEISTLYSTPVDLRTKDLQTLEKNATELERTLVERSQDFNDYRKGLQLTWEDVRKSLKPGEAAIEFTDYTRKEKDGGDAVIYVALIVKPDSQYPEMIRLFTGDQLSDIIGSGVSDPELVNRMYGGKDARLYNLVWKPLEQSLKGVKNVYISPSGLLFRVSFPAILNDAGSYLCDNYNIQIEGSTGNISVPAKAASNSSALIFGGIKYNSDDLSAPVWDYLSGTKTEGDAISNILSKGNFRVEYLTEANATETFFKKSAGNYDFLHLATHGFFFDDPNKVRFEEKKQEIEYGDVTFRGAPRGGFGVSNFVNNSNPLMRSGLVLAGANDVWVKKEQDNTDDGVLTAQEVTQIDMRKTSLVVLSACETGLGDIRGSEGVYGLQRALKMAGVKNIIMSLWQIPDKETVEFMEGFYQKFLAAKDIRRAFSDTQREMRQKYDPYYWGAFVLME